MRITTRQLAFLIALFCTGSICAQGAHVRVKDITSVEGMRINQLTGVGLVTGLNGTGSRSDVTAQFAINFLQSFGQRIDSTQRLAISQGATRKTNNLSVVTVIAELPPFARPGTRLDITVSTFDDAKSLQGGTLLLTPLYGVDNKVYAMAAGALSIGGFSFSGAAASVQKNHPNTARVSNGATVECVVPNALATSGSLRLLLRHPDFSTARRISDVINAAYPGVAISSDPAAVDVLVPLPQRPDVVRFVSNIQQLPVQPDMAARVVINERTGTVVVGAGVKISKVALTHANLSVVTAEAPEVSQPAPFSTGVTAVVPRTQLSVIDENRPVQIFDDSVTVGDLAAALNSLGVTPRDLSAIFQQLHASGALHAELIIN